MGAATSRDSFHWLDYVIFVLVLVISLFIGSLTEYIEKKRRKGREQTQEEYLMGNRDFKVLPVALTLTLSFMSAILVLGTPAEMYTMGTMYWIYGFGIMLASFLAALIFVPLLYPLKLTSAYDYLENRYKSRAAKIVGSFLLVSSQLIYMGIAIYSPSLALEAATGFPVWASILSVGIIASIYTTIGGVAAVVWTSVFQSIVMIGGVLAVAIAGAVQVGGMAQVWEYNQDWHRIEFFNFDPDPTTRHTFWGLIIGGTLLWMCNFGVNQAAVQRWRALPTEQEAKYALYLTMPFTMILFTATCVSGVVVFAYFAMVGCDPISNQDVTSSNQLVPYFIMRVLAWPGFPGLFVSALFAGALSTMSSVMNALAAVCWEDFLKWKLDYLPEKTKTIILKCLVFLFGLGGIGMAFAAQQMGGTVLQASLAFTGSALAPLMGLFLMGGIFPWANWIGAVVGGLTGLCFPMWISIGAYLSEIQFDMMPMPTLNCTNLSPYTAAPRPEPTGIALLYTVSYLWYAPIGMATTIVVGLIVSLITGPMKANEVESKYLIPIFDRLFCCFPDKWRAKCRCGYEDSDDDEAVFGEKRNNGLEDGEVNLSKHHSYLGKDNPVYSTSFTELSGNKSGGGASEKREEALSHL